MRITDPFSSVLSSVSLRSSPEVSTPSNSRCPEPATTGMIQKWNSSIRWSRTSVSSKRLVPYLMRSLPGWSFSRAIAVDGSGPRRVAFHAVWVSDRDATYLGMALMRSM